MQPVKFLSVFEGDYDFYIEDEKIGDKVKIRPGGIYVNLIAKRGNNYVRVSLSVIIKTS